MWDYFKGSCINSVGWWTDAELGWQAGGWKEMDTHERYLGGDIKGSNAM